MSRRKSMREEREFIKLGLKTKLYDKYGWQPLSIAWFSAWKHYVNFDGEGEETRTEEVSCLDKL